MNSTSLHRDGLRLSHQHRSKDELIDMLVSLQNQETNGGERTAFFARETNEGLLIHHNGLIEGANEAASRILRISCQELVGRMVSEFVVGGMHEQLALSAIGEDRRTAIWGRSDGTTFMCECYQRPYQSRQVLHFVEVVSERANTNERIRLSEEIYALYNQTPCGYHTIDERGIVVNINATELDWLGYEKAEVVGQMHMERLLSPRGRRRFQEFFEDLKLQGSKQDLEFDFERKDGSLFPVLLSAVAVRNGEGQLLLCRFTVFDITELRRATKDQAESEEKFRAIAEQSLMGIFIIQEKRIIYANESMQRILGYSPQELHDLGPDAFLGLIDEHDREIAKRALDRVLLDGQVLSPRDLRGRTKAERPVWLQLSASHVILRGASSIFGMVADITEKKKAEKEKQAILTRTLRQQSAISRVATCEGLATGDRDSSFRLITETAISIVKGARASVWLLNKQQNALYCHLVYDRATQTFYQPRLTLDSEDIPYYFQELAQVRTRLLTPNGEVPQPTDQLIKEHPLDVAMTLHSAIRLSGTIVGAFCLEHTAKTRVWRPDEITFIGEMADQVAHALLSYRRKASETALRKAEAEVRQLNDRLQERDKARSEQLSVVQQQLRENTQRAGMADVATAVLHNVGNILTSVITSGQTIEKTVQTSSIRSLKKATKVLGELLDLQDPKAAKLLEFFHLLEDLLAKEQTEICENVEQVLKKVDLIRDVIISQQSLASSDSQAESLFLPDIIEEALSIQEHTLGRYDVHVDKIYMGNPHVFVSKIKLIHVIVNIIKNAREAMELHKIEDRKITLFTAAEGDRALLKIRDSGVGIAPEQLDKLFRHGHSTKRGGHGFGLHSCLTAMNEMGGTIWAESEGLGHGATFVLSLPLYVQELTLDHPPQPHPS